MSLFLSLNRTFGLLPKVGCAEVCTTFGLSPEGTHTRKNSNKFGFSLA